MAKSRATQRTYLRFQVRWLLKRERQVLYLLSKACKENRAAAEQELERVRRHKREVEDPLTAFLQGHQASST